MDDDATTNAEPDETIVYGDQQPDATADETLTLGHAANPTNRAGLRIRCPHCSNPVELLSESASDAVDCDSCGNGFSLVDRPRKDAVVSGTVGRFELRERLGSGGFGTVWKAWDPELDRFVAIKLPRSGYSYEDTELFYREAQSTAQLKHSNIVRVYEVGRHEDSIFIVCDLINGVTLSDRLKQSRLSIQEAVNISRTMVAALEHAHSKGIIHRDLKPSNIMIDTEGSPVLMDFGLAKRETNEVTMTLAGQIMGTPSYMSPEQAKGSSLMSDQRTDIYSFGVVLFRMITNELPFRGNVQMQIKQRLSDDAPDPRSLNKYIPRDLAVICSKCLQREPRKRYQTTNLLAAELDRYASGKPILARPVSRIETAWRWAKRKPAIAAIVGLTTFIAFIGPLAAERLRQQRNQLRDKVVERDQMIANNNRVRDEESKQVALLSEQLRFLRGNANPWDYWPPDKVHSSNRKIFETWFDAHFHGIEEQLKDPELSDDDRLYGHLSLAELARQLERADDAIPHLLAAIDLVHPLVKQNPDNREWVSLLAALYAQSAELHFMLQERTDNETNQSLTQFKKISAEHLAFAADLLSQLSGNEPDSVEIHARLLDVKLRQSGFSNVSRHLSEIRQLNEKLEGVPHGNMRALYQAIKSLRNAVE